MSFQGSGVGFAFFHSHIRTWWHAIIRGARAGSPGRGSVRATRVCPCCPTATGLEKPSPISRLADPLTFRTWARKALKWRGCGLDTRVGPTWRPNLRAMWGAPRVPTRVPTRVGTTSKSPNQLPLDQLPSLYVSWHVGSTPRSLGPPLA